MQRPRGAAAHPKHKFYLLSNQTKTVLEPCYVGLKRMILAKQLIGLPQFFLNTTVTIFDELK